MARDLNKVDRLLTDPQFWTYNCGIGMKRCLSGRAVELFLLRMFPGSFKPVPGAYPGFEPDLEIGGVPCEAKAIKMGGEFLCRRPQHALLTKVGGDYLIVLHQPFDYSRPWEMVESLTFESTVYRISAEVISQVLAEHGRTWDRTDMEQARGWAAYDWHRVRMTHILAGAGHPDPVYRGSLSCVDYFPRRGD